MKNTLIGILIIIALGSLAFGYIQNSKLDEVQRTFESDKEALQKIAQQQELEAREFQKMAVLAQQEAEVQRAICEEQLKALKNK